MRKINSTKHKLLQVKEYIAEAYVSGTSLREVADSYQTSVGSIRALLIEMGIPLRKPGRPKKEVC
jgi:hypothetical protein